MVEVTPSSREKGEAPLICRFAQSEAERQIIYELRYRVYVEEMAVQMASADHAKKIVCDDLDQYADILFVASENRVVGTIRSLWGGRHLPKEYVDFYLLDGPFAHLPLSSFAFSSQLVIDRDWRQGLVLRLLLREAYRRVRYNGAWLDFLHCAPALVSLYEGLGYRRISNRMIDTQGIGQQCAMVLVADDLTHLARARSPFLAEARRFPAEPGHGAWFSLTFPEYAASTSYRVLGEDDFLRSLSAHLIADQVEIFHGITETDISDFVQSGVILSVREGDAIVRAGEVGRELFIILNGAAEVRVRSGANYVVSMTFGKGDLFGEVAFVHGGRRSADVIALSDVRVLAVSPDSLETLVQENPTFGARLSFNIARILATRLAYTNDRYVFEVGGMAVQLRGSYATLERKVEERTHQLELANLAKSRFLATASHDLRQPLHALGLFVAQLRDCMSEAEGQRIVGHIDAAVAGMNELFNALLDISKLDAGALTPNITEFPVAQVLKRIESTFDGAAREKGLSLRFVPTTAWVRSDFILLERILLNLVSNAVRYTFDGGLVVGCRNRGEQLRIEVWDTGPGIAVDQRQKIFDEFYRLGGADADGRAGLGLGLAIVDRLCRLLDHPIELTSTLGQGSRFTVVAPIVAARATISEPPIPSRVAPDITSGKLVVVIDDDPLVLDGMGGLLRSWGCRVVTGRSGHAALTALNDQIRPPDLIISDFHLSGGKTGIEVIADLRSAFPTPIPAFLLSGDITAEPLRKARASGYHLLHKPVDPMTLRAMLNRMLKSAGRHRSTRPHS